MEPLIKQAEQNFEHLFDRTEKQCCLHRKDHEKYRAAFICSEPSCNKRLICSMCMVTDENHKIVHKNYIKPLPEMRAFVVDRCNDKFVSEISLITQDLTTKFNSKLLSCAGVSTSLTAEIMAKELPQSIALLQARFNQKLTVPVLSLAERAQARIEGIALTAQQDHGLGIENDLAKAIQFVEQKGAEEKSVWDTAGKVMQRVKHRILYNKDVEANLRHDLESLSRKYVDDLVRTFESYFFLEDDIDQDTPMRDPMVPPIRFSSPSKVSRFSPEEGREINWITKEITASHTKRIYQEVNLNNKNKNRKRSEDSQASDGQKTWNPPNHTTHLDREGSPFRHITVSQIKTLSPMPKLDEALVQESDRPSSRENWDNMFLVERTHRIVASDTKQERNTLKNKLGKSGDKQTKTSGTNHPERDRSYSANNDRNSSGRKVNLSRSSKFNEEELVFQGGLNESSASQLRRLKEFVDISGIRNLVQKSILRTRVDTGRNAFELWVPNDETQFSKMFKEDFRYFCLSDLLSTEEISGFMQSFYELYYPGLFYVFLHYQSRSMTYPGLSWMEMNRLMAACGILGDGFHETDLDQIFEEVAHNFQSISLKDNYVHLENIPERSLLRSGFMAYLARVALCRYYRDAKRVTPAEALSVFMKQFLNKARNARHEYDVYRNLMIQTEEVNAKVQFFQDQLESTYEDIKDNDGYLSLSKLIEWIDTTDLILNENEVQQCFCLSKMPILLETVAFGKSYMNMEFVEFVEFLVRVSDLDFYNQEQAALSSKVRQTLQSIFFIF